MKYKREQFRILDDPTRINIDIVTHLLAETYWGHKRSRAIVEKLIQNSLCFSLFSREEQVGFTRVVSDHTVFSWISDLVIAENYRNQGLGEWLLDCILNHPSISQTQFVLQTKSAYQLYEKSGFKRNDKLMTRTAPTANPIIKQKQ